MVSVLLLQTAVTVLQNIAMALLVGTALAHCWLEPPRTRAPGAGSRLLDRTGRATIIAALLLHAAALWLQSALMAEVPLSAAAGTIAPVLTGSHFGQMWIAGLAALLVLAILQWRGNVSVPLQWVGALALAGFALSRAEVSHAAADASVYWPVAIEALHWLLISSWTGSIVVAGWIVLPTAPLETVSERVACLAYAKRLSSVATTALTGILVTGGISAWREIGAAAHWIDSGWSQLLALKLALVAVAIGLGGLNRWRGLPALQHAVTSIGDGCRRARRRFVLVLRVESILFGVILLVAANLSSSVPPAAG